MAESIVVVPYDTSIGLDASKDDYDFIGFSFNGIFSINDKFKIYRVSDGSRYTNKLGASNTEKTAENTGGDGTYYFGTLNRSKSFQINFVFDDLTDSGLRELKDWLCTDQLGDLWFYEEPYKVYTAKPVGEPNIKFIAFDSADGAERLYKGEGSVEFVAYWPYAHTPDLIQYYQTGQTEPIDIGDGRNINNYKEDTDPNNNRPYFKNATQWGQSSKMDNNPGIDGLSCTNYGQLPAYFTITGIEDVPSMGGTIYVGKDNQITIPACRNLIWDSQKGTVIAEPYISEGVYGPSQLIAYTGNPCGTIPVGGVSGTEPDIVDCFPGVFNELYTLNYHYWYR